MSSQLRKDSNLCVLSLGRAVLDLEILAQPPTADRTPP